MGNRRYLVVGVAFVVMLLSSVLVGQENGGKRPAEKPAAGRATAQQSSTDATTQEAAGRESVKAEESQKAEDENAQFKQSPSVKLIAKWLGVTTDKAYWISIWINFAIVALLVGFGLKKALPKMFQQRTAAIQKGMEEARRSSEDANRRLHEIEDRLSRLDSEIAQLESMAAQQGDEDEVRQKAAADEEQRRMIAAAEQEISAAANAARRDLKAYSAELAVSLAEKQIKVDAATDQELVRDFVDQLGRNGRQ
jgi:F-type H+-transporting ATPase subunit b